MLTNKLVEIKEILVTHFKHSYEESISNSVDNILLELQALQIPKLATQQCHDLNKPISSLEIEDTVFQLGSHKALGLDGIPTFFFQEYQGIVEADIINTVQAFFI